MVKFDKQKTILVKIPERNIEVNMPDLDLVYGDGAGKISNEYIKQVTKKLFLNPTYQDVSMNIFLGLGLFERFSVLQQNPSLQITPEDYEKIRQRARRLMVIYGCITSSYVEDEDLCRAFLCGVVDFHNTYGKVLS